MQKLDTKRNPQCPRCGYDLRGVMSLWEDSCPLMGKCSECGLDYEWAIVCDPLKYEPLWCVEFSPGLKSVPKSSFKTFCCSFVPWSFWSRVSMSHEVRKKRLFAYLCCLLLPLLLSYILIQSSVAVYVLYKTRSELDTAIAELPREIQILENDIAGMNWEEEVQYLPEEEREEAIKNRQNAMQQQLNNMIQAQMNLPQLHQSYPVAVCEAIFYPMSSHSSGYYLYPDSSIYSSTFPYYPPGQLHEMVLYDIAIIVGPYFTDQYIWYYLAFPVAFVGVAGIVYLVAFPFTFVLLPQSTKKAKVQWRHIVRIAVYSAYIPFASILFFVLLYIAGALAIIIGLSEDFVTAVVVGGGMSVWLLFLVWWPVAIKRYLKMPHGLAIVVLLSLVIFLLMATVTVLVSSLYIPNYWV